MSNNITNSANRRKEIDKKVFALHNVENRSTELVTQLTEPWEASVRATHHFLTKDNICEIRSFVPKAISNV